MKDDDLFTLDEVLGGFSAKRTRLLLFQIENRTAYSMTQARRAADPYLTEEAAEQQDLAFFAALTEGRESSFHPTIRDLERYASDWQSLVPPNLTLQAGLASLLGQKYRFAKQDIPHIREALGLDTERVKQAFQRQYRQPLETIYTSRANLLEEVRWQWNKLSGWLEHLPPFWTAYALTFTQTVGASILALPIALADVGPLAGLVILVVMGLLNMLTIAAMAEAVIRNGSIRYHGSYLGRLVQDYLGRTGSLLLTIIVILHCTLALFALYFGFSLTLAGATPVRAEVWAIVLFLLGCAVVRRNSLHATVTSALVVGAITLSLILLLSGLALPHLRLEHLLYIHVPFLNGQPFEPALLGLVFGVIFTAYFGHFSVSSCASTVLRRDPSGRSLTWGCIAAQASAMMLYILWVVAVNGAIAPQSLAGFSGTALTPLAQLVGPVANICGAILAILAMGMASIHISMTLFLTTRERIPGSSRHTLVLGRRQGKLLFTPGGKVMNRLALIYLGLKETQPQLRLELQWEGKTRRFEIEGNTTWEASTCLAELAPDLPSSGIHLTLRIMRATAETVRVQCTTPMRMAYEANWDTLGLDLLDMVDVEAPEMDFVSWLAGREQATLEEIIHFLQTEQNPQAIVNRLVERGVVSAYKENRQTVYRVHFAARRRRQVPSTLWQTLDPTEHIVVQEREAAQRMKRWMWLSQVKARLQGEIARSWLALSPLLLIFLLVEWLLGNKLESFSQLMDLRGVITVPVVAGVFPILLLLASRRKGENIPAFVLPFLAHPMVAGGIYLVAVSTLFLHGLLIWQDPFQRGVALLIGVVILAITALLMRQGAFTRRMVIEVRQDPPRTEQANGTFMMTDCGRAARQSTVCLGYLDGEYFYQEANGTIPHFGDLCSAKFSVPTTQAQELMVWVHRVTLEGHSENLPVLVKVTSAGQMRTFHLNATGQRLVLSLRAEGKQVSKEEPREAGPLEVEVQLAATTAEGTSPIDEAKS